MAATVTVIPATIARYNAAPLNTVTKRRVAGYARVSTELQEQQSSYLNQIEYYKRFIRSRADWELVGIYTDEGISATNTARREGFRRMIDDALSGKIDLIITKSVSRFARNTVDSLVTVRRLKEKGIEIYFEKENIWTLDAKGELMITIMSSLAQEESRSISENTVWGVRKSFADGKASVGYKSFLGYDKDFVINEEQAKVVRLIYELFLKGYSAHSIAKELMARGIKSPRGGDTWYVSAVNSILRNEKYKGDALLQKRYTADFLTKKLVENRGEVPQYYVSNHHEPIISPEIFDLTQAELAERGKKELARCKSRPFSSKIRCGVCGRWYTTKLQNAGNPKYAKRVWRCSGKRGGSHACTSPTFSEAELRGVFLAAVRKVVETKEAVLEQLNRIEKVELNDEALTTRREGLQRELNGLGNRAEDELAYNALRAQIVETDERIGELRGKRIILDGFRKHLHEMEEAPGEYDDGLFGMLVDCVIATERENIVVRFKGGVEVGI